MVDLYRYSNAFEPILLEGLTATLFGADIPTEGMNVVCRAVMALPEYYKDFGSLTAATWDNDNEDTNLELSTMELGQFRFRLPDDIQCRLKNPAAVQYWRTAKTNFYVPQFPDEEGSEFLKEFFWKASEFFVFEDTTPRFDFYSPVALARTRVLFSGWKFNLAKIQTKGRIEIWVSSWPPTSK